MLRCAQFLVLREAKAIANPTTTQTKTTKTDLITVSKIVIRLVLFFFNTIYKFYFALTLDHLKTWTIYKEIRK